MAEQVVRHVNSFLIRNPESLVHSGLSEVACHVVVSNALGNRIVPEE